MHAAGAILTENLVAKLTSFKWLKEATLGRAKNLINSINFVPHTIVREVAGETFSFYIGNPTGKSWYGTDIDASLEMQFIKKEFIRPGTIAIECGAHHGAQSILLSRWVGNGGKVIVIEPMPENLAILKKNIELNSLENVVVIEKAAGPSCGFVSMKRSSNSAVSTKSDNSVNTIQVEFVTLDEISKELGVIPTFIKIDIEGFEYKLLQGSREILSHNPGIFLEVHTLTLPRYGNKFEDLWNFIDPNDYDIFIQGDDFEEPSPYSPNEVPQDRVHLFFKPRKMDFH